MEEISEKAVKFWHMTAPGLLIFVLFLLSVIPYSIPGYTGIKPDLLLIAVFYWAIHRPRFLSPFICFSLGLLLDIFSFFPLGVHAFVFVLVHKFISDQRKVFIGQPFYVSWLGFAFICLLSHIIKGAVFALFFKIRPELDDILLHMALSISLFPVVMLLLAGAHRLMIEARRKG